MSEMQYSNWGCWPTAVIFVKECQRNNLQGLKDTTVLSKHPSASALCPSAETLPFPLSSFSH